MRAGIQSRRPLFILASIAAVFAAGIALYPQARLVWMRGNDLQGTFATWDLDETAYAAYVKGLSDGRPRKNDPYTGRDDVAGEPQSESLFSIQFAPSYAAAAVSRLFGLTPPVLMVLIGVLGAVGTALAAFYLVYLITENPFLAFAGALTVVTCGALISDLGAINSIRDTGIAYPFFPFLRRHIPSLSFPFLFLFLAALWKVARWRIAASRWLWGGVAVLCFNVLVYSYFYLWTSAAAVLCVFAAATLIESRLRDWSITLIGICCAASLVPFAFLTSLRSESLDKTQLLITSHASDLTRPIEVIGIALVLVPIALSIGKRALLDGKTVAFLTALGLAPMIVFNQRVISGFSLQPFHYQYYSMNYVTLLALVLVIATVLKLFLQDRTRALAVSATIWALLALGWGITEAALTTAFWDDINVARDESHAADEVLDQIVPHPPNERNKVTTLNLDSLQGDLQPAETGIPVLWARHQHVFAGLGPQENVERYFALLYYSDLDGEWLTSSLKDCSNIEACMILFGWDRFNATLSESLRPLTNDEIEKAAADFENYSSTFNAERSVTPRLSLLVKRSSENSQLGNLRRWYDVGEEHRAGEFSVYELKLK